MMKKLQKNQKKFKKKQQKKFQRKANQNPKMQKNLNKRYLKSNSVRTSCSESWKNTEFDRDAFLAHSMNFDLDDNGYLKKAEFVEAAKAFTAEGEAEAEDSTEDTSQEDEPASSSEDSESGEAESSEQEAKNCPICGTSNAHDAAACVACNYTFE